MKAFIHELRQLTLTDLIGYILYCFLFSLLAWAVTKWFLIGVAWQVIRLIFDLFGRALNRQITKLNG